MTAAPHILEVGPHAHRWRTVHVDGRGDGYQACELCGTRRCLAIAGSPLRQDWIEGGAWDRGEAPAAVSPKPAPRRRRQPTTEGDDA